MARTVRIGDKEYELRRQTLALERDLAPLQDTLIACLREVSDIQIKRNRVEQRRSEFMVEDDFDPGALEASGEEWVILSRALRDKALEQAEIELRLIAVRLVDPPPIDELVDQLDEDAREEITKAIERPPTNRNGTGTDSESVSAISGSE